MHPWVFLFALGLLGGCHLWSTPADPVEAMRGPLVIRTGTSFGHCLGYCESELVVAEEQAVMTLRAPRDQTLPDRRGERAVSDAEWDALTAALDLAAFRQMDDVYGCPDCADGGAEWVEVATPDFEKRVTFEHGATLAPLAEVLALLRPLRDDLRDELD